MAIRAQLLLTHARDRLMTDRHVAPVSSANLRLLVDALPLASAERVSFELNDWLRQNWRMWQRRPSD